jgi:hypothetical protein
MALITAERVKETATTTGTGNFTLAGAVTGFRTFGSVCANNDYAIYCIAHKTAAEWEVGIGQWQTGGTFVRTAGSVLTGSSGAGTLVNFSAGDKEVFITQNANFQFLPSLSANPATPSSGAILYNRADATRVLPRWIGPSGLDQPVQPALFAGSITMWLPGTGTTASINFGISWTVATTQATPTIADTSIMTRLKRATFTTTTTAANTTGVRSAAPVVVCRSGFYMRVRFGILTYTSTMRVWAGLSALSGALGGDPSAQNHSVCMSKDTGETTWQVLTRDASAASKTSTGRTTAAGGNTEIFDFRCFRPPGNGISIGVRVVDVATETVVLDDTLKSSNLPGDDQLLYSHCEAMNVAGGAGSAVAIFLAKIYVETDL